ncbi:hypothetical protein VTL71DRAFT_7934 [Oculimacula yallundae]|uniref:F-box domain-containing protein n=1 Tax=Oculimacula yallundae TaxID=86028 RepID=A0ABR4CW42_9HELO
MPSLCEPPKPRSTATATQDGYSSDNSQNPSHLCRLSNEILCLIAAAITDSSDLYALTRTCKLLCDNASPILYKSIVIKDENTFRRLAAGRISFGPHLLKHIQGFKFSMWFYESYERVADMPASELLPMHLTETLPDHLVACILKWMPGNFWDFKTAIHLFEHPSLRKLELHSASSSVAPRSNRLVYPMNVFLRSFTCSTPGVTSLETLSLIGCNIDAADLQQMLSYPRALRFLSICPNHSSPRFPLARVPNRDTFSSISTTRSSKSIIGFRYDAEHSNIRTTAPYPRLDFFESVHYLELGYKVLGTIPRTLIKDILPPKLEVLKIFDFKDNNDNTINGILQNKSNVPSLRRIILVLHYRNAAMAAKLNIADRRDMAQAVRLQGNRVQTERKTYDSFSAACKARGVELMLLYEDCRRKWVSKEGARLAVWEIPEQIVLANVEIWQISCGKDRSKSHERTQEGKRSRAHCSYIHPVIRDSHVVVGVDRATGSSKSAHPPNGNKTNQWRGTILRFHQQSLFLLQPPTPSQKLHFQHLFAKFFSLTTQFSSKTTNRLFPHTSTNPYRRFSMSWIQLEGAFEDTLFSIDLSP